MCTTHAIQFLSAGWYIVGLLYTALCRISCILQLLPLSAYTTVWYAVFHAGSPPHVGVKVIAVVLCVTAHGLLHGVMSSCVCFDQLCVGLFPYVHLVPDECQFNWEEEASDYFLGSWSESLALVYTPLDACICVCVGGGYVWGVRVCVCVCLCVSMCVYVGGWSIVDYYWSCVCVCLCISTVCALCTCLFLGCTIYRSLPHCMCVFCCVCHSHCLLSVDYCRPRHVNCSWRISGRRTEWHKWSMAHNTRFISIMWIIKNILL